MKKEGGMIMEKALNEIAITDSCSCDPRPDLHKRLGCRSNLIVWLVILVILFCCCSGSNNSGCCFTGCNSCCRVRRRNRGFGGFSIFGLLIIFALLAGGSRGNTNTNVINLNTDDDSDLDDIDVVK